jgi:beta-D-xylosidase 4
MYDDDFTTRRPSIGDMSLSGQGGITYQYYQGVPLWPFGWGLSYTTFAMSWASPSELTVSRDQLVGRGSSAVGRAGLSTQQARLIQGQGARGERRQYETYQAAYNVSVTNTGEVASDVSVLGFLSFEQDTDAPLPHPQRELVSFCRLRDIAPGATKQCELVVAPDVVAHNSVVYSGSYALSVELGDGAGIRGRLVVTE